MKKWNTEYLKAALSIHGREKKVEECAELIEKNLIVLGVTAIEDKLQEVLFFSNKLYVI